MSRLLSGRDLKLNYTKEFSMQRVLSVSLPKEVLQMVDKMASERHETRSAFIRDLIRNEHAVLKEKELLDKKSAKKNTATPIGGGTITASHAIAQALSVNNKGKKGVKK